MPKLIKVAYFDEQAAVDILEIVDGGSTLKTISQTLKKDGSISAEAQVGTSWFNIVGFGLRGNAKKEKTSYIQSQITSTLMSDFLKNFGEGKIKLLEVDRPNLRIQKESNAYYRNLLPMIHMIKDFNAIEVDNTTRNVLNALDFDRFGTSLDMLSAYYEMEGIYNDKPAIFRFNIDGLRNNYTLLDLGKITQIKIYGILVGDSESMDLTFNKEITDMVGDQKSDFDNDYDSLTKSEAPEKEETTKIEKYPVVDVILAGVEA